MLNHTDFVGDLGAAENRDEGTLGIVNQLAERGDFLVDQKPGVRRQQMRDAFGRGMGAMGGSEGVIDIKIG
jgi:hypothetical protein